MNDLLTPVRIPAAQQNGQTPERPLTPPPDGQPFAPEKGRRRSSDMFDEAESISSLVGSSGLTQEKIAERLSVSQSYVANKLRLLRFTGEEREIIRASGLTERHARAALRLSDRSRRISALREMIKRNMNVASAEEFVETLLCSGDPLPIPPEEPHSAGRPGTDLGSLCLSLGTTPGLMNFKLRSMSGRGIAIPVPAECDSRFLAR